ncbi:pyroglutamyl-peptidase I [Micrococcus terreus]|uniref:pyroglutamyl-peptidase I n=1 Tax=Micrococcus terreus TaxID=574650 RepID=UPI0033E4EC2D
MLNADAPVQVLLTGFEPFGGDAHNPSWPAAQEAATLLRERGVAAAAALLPCEFAASGPVLDEALRRHQPEVVIACGLAGGRAAVTVERVAVNLQDARIPDNAGHQPAGTAVVDDGPVAWFSTLPVKRVAGSIQGEGIPAELSLSAGSFVCNHVFAHLMSSAPALDVRCAGFIHVPWDAEHAPDGITQTLPAEQLARALAVAALQALDPAPDLDTPEGTLH